jgi:hypothetical protein
MKRGRLRFSLLTLFLSITAFGCWLGYEVNWIHNRHDALRDGIVVDDAPWRDDIPAPAFLWLFGERGYDRLVYLPEWADESAVVAFSVLVREDKSPNGEFRSRTSSDSKHCFPSPIFARS